MDPTVLALIVLVREIMLPAIGIVAGGVVLVKTPVGRRLMDYVLQREDTSDLREMRARLDELQYQLDETQERLDAAERMLTTPRFQLPGHQPPVEPATPV